MAATPFYVYDNWLRVRNECGLCSIAGLEGKALVTLLTNAYTIDVINHTNVSDISSFNPASAYSGDAQVDLVSLSGLPSGKGTMSVLVNPSWTASGGALTFLYAAIYVEATGDLIAVSKLNTLDVDISVPDGVLFTLDILANGIYTDTRV